MLIGLSSSPFYLDLYFTVASSYPSCSFDSVSPRLPLIVLLVVLPCGSATFAFDSTILHHDFKHPSYLTFIPLTRNMLRILLHPVPRLSIIHLRVSPFPLSLGSCLSFCHLIVSLQQRALTDATAGSTQGQSFAQSTKENDRLRMALEIQTAEFEIIRKSLVKDLQNRCEKVGQIREQFSDICVGS